MVSPDCVMQVSEFESSPHFSPLPLQPSNQRSLDGISRGFLCDSDRGWFRQFFYPDWCSSSLWICKCDTNLLAGFVTLFLQRCALSVFAFMVSRNPERLSRIPPQFWGICPCNSNWRILAFGAGGWVLNLEMKATVYFSWPH